MIESFFTVLFSLLIFVPTMQTRQQATILEEEIILMESEISSVETKIQNKEKEFAYRQTDQYKDKFYKKNMDLLNPSERVILIPEGQLKKEFESSKFYEENLEKINEVESGVKNFLESENIEVKEVKKLETAREIHIQTEDGIWIWLNLMIEIGPQLEKLNLIINEGLNDDMFEEYIDLRIPGRIIYK